MADFSSYKLTFELRDISEKSAVRHGDHGSGLMFRDCLLRSCYMLGNLHPRGTIFVMLA